MPNRKSYANADWMRMRFSCSLDKHGNCEVELDSTAIQHVHKNSKVECMQKVLYNVKQH